MSPATKITDRDRDCAQIARAALFPKQINRDGSHSTIFPAAEALTKVRDSAMVADPNRAPSSFFPKGVVVVREIGHEDTLKWNGQPDIEDKDASFELIPRMLSVKCIECANIKLPAHKKAFIDASSTDEAKEALVVLCTDRLLKSDYKPSMGSLLDLPPRTFSAVEEALAHEVTIVGDQIEYSRGDTTEDPATCKGLASSEMKAARAAECYYSKNGKEVKRGSGLPVGFSLLPMSIQTKLLNRCIRSVATAAVTDKFGSKDGKQCVEETIGA